MFDWLNWHIGAGKHTIRLALYLDIYGVSFSILKNSNTSRRLRYFKNVCIVWNSLGLFKMCQFFFFQNCSSEVLKKIYTPVSLSHLTLAHSYTILQHIENSQAQGRFSASKWQLKEITPCFAEETPSKEAKPCTSYTSEQSLCLQLLPDYITQIKAQSFDWITHAQN